MWKICPPIFVAPPQRYSEIFASLRGGTRIFHLWSAEIRQDASSQDIVLFQAQPLMPSFSREQSGRRKITVRGIGPAFLFADTMNAANPFQIPACLQRAEQRRRERIKGIFFAILAAHVILFAGLLIQGCQSKPVATTAASDGYPPALLAKLSSHIEQ
jgi:hypothetical protein